MAPPGTAPPFVSISDIESLAAAGKRRKIQRSLLSLFHPGSKWKRLRPAFFFARMFHG
jgi:hypothetical protein